MTQPPPSPAPPTPPTPAEPPPLDYGDYANASRTSAAAVTALVLGILALLSGCFIPLLLAIPAVIFGAVGIAKTADPQVKGRGMAIAGLVMGLVSALLGLTVGIAILQPSMNRAREAANRIKCASNLRQIGQAMLRYSIADVREGNGNFPPDLETLYANADLVPDVMVCPSSNAELAPPPFVLSQNNSYVYLGAGMTGAVPSTTTAAYCEIHNHQIDATNILYADGSVSAPIGTGEVRNHVEDELRKRVAELMKP